MIADYSYGNNKPKGNTLNIVNATARYEDSRNKIQNDTPVSNTVGQKPEATQSTEIPYILREAPSSPLPIVPSRFIEKNGLNYNPNSTATNEASLIFLGDLMARWYQHKEALQDNGSYNFNMSFKYVKDYFQKADLVIGNLETALSHSFPYRLECRRYMGQMNCNAPATYLDALRFAGIDAVVTSNNHCCDAGKRGIIETLQHLERYRIPSTGLFASPEDRRFMIFDVNGIKIAVLSYSYGFNGKSVLLDEGERNFTINKFSEAKFRNDVSSARKSGAEFVAVYMHWGKEHTTDLTGKQLKNAKILADFGADIILGSHPHVLQKFDYLVNSVGHKVPIIYSLGNFLSDMAKVPENRHTVMLNVNLVKTSDSVEIKSITYVPCSIVTSDDEDKYVVVPLGDKGNNVIDSDKQAYIINSIASSVGNLITPDI